MTNIALSSELNPNLDNTQGGNDMSSSDAKNTNTGNDIAPTIDPKDILRNLNTVVKELMREYNTQQEQKTAADANNDIVASGRLVQKLG